MKIYKCRYCNKEGDRKSIRACIMTHTKTDKKGRKQVGETKENSNITQNMIRRDL